MKYSKAKHLFSGSKRTASPLTPALSPLRGEGERRYGAWPGFIAIAFVLAVVGVFLAGCKRSEKGDESDVAYYTCTMHPSVRSQDPKAKCPICGMDLVPVKKKAAESTAADYYTCTMHPSVKSKDPKAK